MKAEPLTREAFSPFGQVIEADPDKAFEINAGFTTRFHALADVDADRPVISIFRGRVRPLELVLFERHPLASQAFMPLEGRDWLVAVAETPTAPRLFHCRGDQGVQYNRNVWHHPLLVLDGPQDFLVVDRSEPDGNLEEHNLDEKIYITI
jgi:ureidoglycolate lyase